MNKCFCKYIYLFNPIVVFWQYLTKSDSTFSELNHGFESLGVGQSHHPEELGPATALM